MTTTPIEPPPMSDEVRELITKMYPYDRPHEYARLYGYHWKVFLISNAIRRQMDAQPVAPPVEPTTNKQNGICGKILSKSNLICTHPANHPDKCHWNLYEWEALHPFITKHYDCIIKEAFKSAKPVADRDKVAEAIYNTFDTTIPWNKAVPEVARFCYKHADSAITAMSATQVNLSSIERDREECRGYLDNAWRELKQIREAIAADLDESTLDEVVRLKARYEAVRAELAALRDALRQELVAPRESLINLLLKSDPTLNITVNKQKESQHDTETRPHC